MQDASTGGTTQPRLPASDSSPLSDGSVPCAQCAQVNGADRKFCSSCGASLYEKCPECRVENAIVESFCGACGADLKRLFAERRAGCESDLAAARQLIAEHRYEEAAHQLRLLSRVTETRLLRYAETAKAEMETISQQRVGWRAQAVAAVAEAKQSLVGHDYEGAVAAIEKIPLRMRDEQCRTLYHQAIARRDETVSLVREIRESLEGSNWRQLAISVDRLLVLKPDHARAHELARKVRDRFLQAAQKKQAENEYAAALALLDQIPGNYRDDEVTACWERIAELDWLWQDLTQSPCVDTTLVEVGKRLVQHCPDHAQAAQLAKRAESLLSRVPADSRLAAQPWAKPRGPATSFPVEWLAVPQSMAASEEALAVLRRFPGQFFVAIGLGLQGLELAKVTSHFGSAEAAKGLPRLGFLRRKSYSGAWGIDLGSSSLKAVRLSLTDSAGAVAIDRAVVLKHAKPLTEFIQEEDRRDAQLRLLRAFLEKHPPQEERFCFGLPGRHVLGRFFRPPPVERKKLNELVRYETGLQMPVAMEELAWNHHVFERDEDAGEEESSHFVVVQAVKLFQLQQLLGLCDQVGVKPDVIQSDFLALHNCAQREFFADVEDASPQRDRARILLDVGASGSNLVVTSPSGLWFRHFSVGGDSMTSDLARSFKLTRDQAEQLKREPARARRMRKLFEQLGPTLDNIIGEVQRSLRICHKMMPKLEITGMVGCGGGFSMHGLLRRVREAS